MTTESSTAMLVDVAPSGYARFLTDGIVRARYRESTRSSRLLERGRVYCYEIDLWATSNVFKAGHRIRLYVSSSNFPRFSRNLNTGERMLGAMGMTKALQRIHHDAQYPSALLLPVIPRLRNRATARVTSFLPREGACADQDLKPEDMGQ